MFGFWGRGCCNFVVSNEGDGGGGSSIRASDILAQVWVVPHQAAQVPHGGVSEIIALNEQSTVWCDTLRVPQNIVGARDMAVLAEELN
jgi:hypothetical protein